MSTIEAKEAILKARGIIKEIKAQDDKNDAICARAEQIFGAMRETRNDRYYAHLYEEFAKIRPLLEWHDPIMERLRKAYLLQLRRASCLGLKKEAASESALVLLERHKARGGSDGS